MARFGFSLQHFIHNAIEMAHSVEPVDPNQTAPLEQLILIWVCTVLIDLFCPSTKRFMVGHSGQNTIKSILM